MKNLFSYFGLLFFSFLCSIGTTQGMELENLSIENQRKQYGATSQNKPLQKMLFHPVGPGVDKTLNLFIKPYFRCVEGYYVYTEIEPFSGEIWDTIWGDLDLIDKLNLGSLAHSFKHIRPYVQLDVCREMLLQSRFYNTLRKSYIDVFYEIIVTIRDIHDNTNIDALKTQCNSLLQENKNIAQETIECGSWIKRERNYAQTEDYKKLKYLKEVFKIEPDISDGCSSKCRNECWSIKLDCLDCCRNFGPNDNKCPMICSDDCCGVSILCFFLCLDWCGLGE